MMRTTTAAVIAAALLALTTAHAAAAKERKAARPAKQADGAKLFSTNCASCHGTAGRGDGPSAAKLPAKPADLTALGSSEEQIAGVVRDGKGSCPSWRASLDESEISALARFTRSLQR